MNKTKDNEAEIIDINKYPTRGSGYPYADYKGMKYDMHDERYNPEFDDNLVAYQKLDQEDKALVLNTALVGLKRTDSPRGAMQHAARTHGVNISGWVIRKHLYTIIGREVKKSIKRRKELSE